MKKILKIAALLALGILLFRWFASPEEKFHLTAPEEIIPRTIVAFGDSLTAGYGLTAEDSYPSQLQQKMNISGYGHYTILNMGSSGDTTASGLNRIDEVLTAAPDIVVLALGANDGLRHIPLAETEQNLRRIIRTLQSQEIEVLLVGIRFPFLLGALGYTDDYAEMYEELAEEFEIPLVPSILKGVLQKPELNLPDGKHPNREGYAIVVDTIWRELREML